MATPEAIHCIGCAKDISKSSRDRRKLGTNSTGNPVARKQALSGWKLFLGSSRSNHLVIDTGDKKEAEEEYSKGSFHTPFPTTNFSVYHTLAV